jgi:hypothetical protein
MAVVYGVENVGAVTDPSQVADDNQTVWDSVWGGDIDADVTIGPFKAAINNGAGVVTGDGTSSSAGTASFSLPPPSVALLVSKSSASPGRAGRGRMYVPGTLPENSLDEAGIIDPTSRSVRQTDADGLLIALAAADYPMVILHSGAGTPATVTGLTVQALCANQRRRLGR